MHVLLKGKIFRHGQRYLGSDQTLHHRVIRKVQEHGDMVRHAAFFECITEEVRHIVLDAHRGKHDSKFLIRIFSKGRLLNDLRGKLVMGKTVPREDRQLLPADQSRQAVNG